MVASANGHLDVVKTLIEAGADVNQADKVGILHCFCTLISAHCIVLILYTCSCILVQVMKY